MEKPPVDSNRWEWEHKEIMRALREMGVWEMSREERQALPRGIRRFLETEEQRRMNDHRVMVGIGLIAGLSSLFGSIVTHYWH